MTDSFGAARDCQNAFKHAQIQRYATAFISAGIELLDRGVGHFGSDDVPESAIPQGSGIAGSAITMLLNAHVIAAFWQTIPEQGIYGGRRRSKREARNGAKIPLYRLTSRAAAEVYLTINRAEIPVGQQEMRL